jgi:hypothetical protein
MTGIERAASIAGFAIILAAYVYWRISLRVSSLRKQGKPIPFLGVGVIPFTVFVVLLLSVIILSVFSPS